MPGRLPLLTAALLPLVLVLALAPHPEGSHQQQLVTVTGAPPAEPAVRAPQASLAAPRPTVLQVAPRRASAPASRRTWARPVRRAATFEDRRMQAVQRIPGYRAGVTRWRASGRYGHWGASDVYHRIVYVAPWVPQARLYSVVVHEWGHMLTVRAYDGDVGAAFAAMNAYYGGSGWTGGERAADCIARLLGATWTNYTPCTRAGWRAGARRLIAGEHV